MVSTWSTLLGLTYGFFLGGRSCVIVGPSFGGKNGCRCVVWFLVAGFILPQGMASKAFGNGKCSNLTDVFETTTLEVFWYLTFLSRTFWLSLFVRFSLDFLMHFNYACEYRATQSFHQGRSFNYIQERLIIAWPSFFTMFYLTLFTSSDHGDISDILWLVKIVSLSSDQWGTDEFESKVCELFGSSARVLKGDWIFFDDFLWEEKGTGSWS